MNSADHRSGEDVQFCPCSVCGSEELNPVYQQWRLNERERERERERARECCFKIGISLLQMEDEGNHGNDDTRCFILSTLAALHTSRVACVLCQSPMLVFDRYPLVDGTFFLSPRQHSKCCLEVRNNSLLYVLINSVAYGTWRLNAAFTMAIQ